MVTRLSGLGSGMDIDSLVTKLMTAEKAPLNKLNQKQQSLTWKTDAYRSINTKLAAFRDAFSKLRFGSNWAQTAATSSDTSKVEVTAGTNASASTHNIVVNSLASSGSLYSSRQISQPDLTSSGVTSTTITSTNNQLNVTLNGVTKNVTIASGTYATVSDLGTALQSAVDTAFGANQIKVDTSSGLKLSSLGATGYEPQLIVKSILGNDGLTNLGFTDGQAYKFDASASLDSQESKIVGGINITAGSFQINGQTITITDPSTESLSSIISKVNNSAAGVTMSYDSTTDRISITTKNTGDNATIDIANDSTGFAAAFKLDKAVDENGNQSYKAGASASVVVDGVTGKYSSNTFTNGGITYNLHGTTTAAGVTVGASSDVDGIYKQIEDFVTKYNDLLTSLNTSLNEPKYRSFTPLTSDQKSAMSENDITLWEAKAKSGLLTGDNNLKQIRNSMREIAYSTVSNLPADTNALYKVGITTTTYVQGDTTNAGKLQIDSDKLKKAIAQDPQAVINLFTNQSTNDVKSEKGIMQQLYEATDSSISTISKLAGKQSNSYDNVTFDLGKQINTIEDQISVLENKLTKKEDYYYSMFSKMDTSVSKGNSTLSSLSSFLK
ncbi:flagellar filament capping protein FliD [Paenibacillus rigui]|nr:flagellar filament capping protein FliD [Paenibacillus rigui]